ncbi:MAG: ATP-binding protein [Armatimonadetes bacterium]|nr:ATP-binding protein [Armatimonadota bacterium]
MKELVIVSGKGGTGKTCVAGSLAALAENKVLADCDVDAANLHLLAAPRKTHREPYFGMPKAAVEKEKCRECGLCEQLCRFGAIRNFQVDVPACEGCAVCFYACPAGAVKMTDHRAGYLFVSETEYGPLVHARLGIAEGNSGKLVSAVRRRAKEIAEKEGYGLIITDGPPGIGCPVISSLSGADLALAVTEPTAAGVHDLERVLDLVEHFGIKAAVCINKWDLNPENTLAVQSLCARKKIALAGKIPYDPAVIEAVRRNSPVVRNGSGPAARAMKKLWDRLEKLLSS